MVQTSITLDREGNVEIFLRRLESDSDLYSEEGLIHYSTYEGDKISHLPRYRIGESIIIVDEISNDDKVSFNVFGNTKKAAEKRKFDLLRIIGVSE